MPSLLVLGALLVLVAILSVVLVFCVRTYKRLRDLQTLAQPIYLSAAPASTAPADLGLPAPSPLQRWMFHLDAALASVGGDFVADTWTRRVPTVTELSSSDAVQLDAHGLVVHEPGTYSLGVQAVACDVGLHRLRVGTRVSSAPTSTDLAPDDIRAVGPAVGSGCQLATLSAVIVVEQVPCWILLDHRCSTSRPFEGLGESTAWGTATERFMTVLVDKLL